MTLQILLFLSHAPLGKANIAKKLGKSRPTRYLNELTVRILQMGLIEMTIPSKPSSRLQKYRLTPKGQALLASLRKGGGQ
jgi:DNA-binding MarR family transcriptional regulator